MPLRYRIVVLVSILLFGFNAYEQQKPEVAKPSPLEPVAWLVGGTWVSGERSGWHPTMTIIKNARPIAPTLKRRASHSLRHMARQVTAFVRLTLNEWE